MNWTSTNSTAVLHDFAKASAACQTSYRPSTSGMCGRSTDPSGTTLSIAGCSMSRIVCTICKSQQRTRVICNCERQQRLAYLLANGHAYWQGGAWLGSLILVQSLPTAGAHTQSGPLEKSPKMSISKWQCGYVKWSVPLGSPAGVCSASTLGGCCWLAGAGCCACCC